jgi:hypothetical protein
LDELVVAVDAGVVHADESATAGAARVRFRGAMSAAGDHLICALRDGAEVEAAVADIRRREVEPALADLRDELATFGARDTLLRLGSSAGMVSSALASMSIVAAGATGMVDVPAVLGALSGAPALSAGAKEVLARREGMRRVQASPYWLLHGAEKRMSSS